MAPDIIQAKNEESVTVTPAGASGTSPWYFLHSCCLRCFAVEAEAEADPV